MKEGRDIGALLALVDARVASPHSWGRGRNDCIAFAAAAVEAQTGIDPIGRHKWSTQRGAVRTLKAAAAAAKGRKVALSRCIEALLDARFERIAPARAMRGDIAGVPADIAGSDPKLGLHPMIVEGETLCSPGPRGLQRLPRTAMTVAWDVMSLGRPDGHQPSQPSPSGRGKLR